MGIPSFYVLILQDFDLYSVFRLLVTIVTFLIVFRSLVLMHYLSFICFMVFVFISLWFFVIHYNYIFLLSLPCYKLPYFSIPANYIFYHCFIIFCLHRTFGPLITSSYSVLLFYFEYSSSFFKTSLFFFASCVMFLLLCSFEDINRYKYHQ